MKIVPNEFPKFSNQPYRIAFVGEAPGAQEDECGRPFMGPSGNLLWSIASRYGIVREACFVGNVCQIRPPNNKIELFAFNGPEITAGIAQLSADLAVFKPNLCVLLGGSALRAFTGQTGITSWRGSLLAGNLGTNTRFKCLPALHPAAILREYSGLPLLHFDIKRARLEGEHKELRIPVRDLAVDLSIDEQCARLDDILVRKPVVSIDLEGYWNNMWCISIAESPSKCFLVEFNNSQDLADECQLWRRLAKLLQDPAIGKIAQNAAYELFVMQYGHSIPIRGIVDDTMLAHWELYCELDKNLGLQASIYTREPHWKQEREDDDPTTRKLYCCKDSAVTYEIRNVLKQQLRGAQATHYNFNLALLDPIIYMECKGINYDKTKAEKKTSECIALQHRLQWCLNSIAGIEMPSDVAGWVNISRDVHCFKKLAAGVNSPSALVSASKLTELHRSRRVAELLSVGNLPIAAVGELSDLTDLSLNVESKNQMADFLYRQLGLPIQYKKEHGRLTDKETTDVLALLTLYKKTQDPTLKLALTIRSIRTRLDTLGAATDPDGRIRCGYNIVGTDTGRLSCYESPTGSGFNLQTVSKKDRDLFLPDPGYWFFQCDLSGADGWTVAAHCSCAGDDTMLEDYHFGLKPARIIALLYQFGGKVLQWSREELRDKGRLVDADGWLYFACKRVQHGSNYGMAENTMSDQIVKDSYKLFGEPIYVAPATCAQLRTFYFARYPGILRWHEGCRRKLVSEGCLTSANGHRRVFWGRKKEPSGKVNHQTLHSFLSDEPQNNTTYATNLALHKLWTDPENLTNRKAAEGCPSAQRFDRLQPRRIQPLHQVHDALIGQWPKAETEWAKARVRSYFDNALVIAGVKLVIPFEGNYGESWGSLKQGVI